MRERQRLARLSRSYNKTGIDAHNCRLEDRGVKPEGPGVNVKAY